jgi:hypothetical protein
MKNRRRRRKRNITKFLVDGVALEEGFLPVSSVLPC